MNRGKKVNQNSTKQLMPFVIDKYLEGCMNENT